MPKLLNSYFTFFLLVVPRRPTVKKSPLRKSSQNEISEDFMFGPPPQSQNTLNFGSAQKINKKGTNRRSDQRKNRVFSDNFSLVIMEPPSSSSPSNPSKPSSEETEEINIPSSVASAPVRPAAVARRHALHARRSSDSVTNQSLSGISLSPFNIRQAGNATGSIVSKFL